MQQQIQKMCVSHSVSAKSGLQGGSSVVSRFYEVHVKCWELLGYSVVYLYKPTPTLSLNFECVSAAGIYLI